MAVRSYQTQMKNELGEVVPGRYRTVYYDDGKRPKTPTTDADFEALARAELKRFIKKNRIPGGWPRLALEWRLPELIKEERARVEADRKAVEALLAQMAEPAEGPPAIVESPAVA